MTCLRTGWPARPIRRSPYAGVSLVEVLAAIVILAVVVLGAVGLVNGAGFLKDYRYDTRFLLNPPPHLPPIGYEFQAWSLDP